MINVFWDFFGSDHIDMVVAFCFFKFINPRAKGSRVIDPLFGEY